MQKEINSWVARKAMKLTPKVCRFVLKLMYKCIKKKKILNS